MNKNDKKVIQQAMGTIENLNEDLRLKQEQIHEMRQSQIIQEWQRRYKKMSDDFEGLVDTIMSSEYSYKAREKAEGLAKKYNYNEQQSLL